jgi:hypothetical protein
VLESAVLVQELAACDGCRGVRFEGPSEFGNAVVLKDDVLGYEDNKLRVKLT